MKLIVNPHKIEILKEPINEREIDITKCEFEFADEITSDYVKEAYFTFNGESYKQIIVNNQCNIPNEVLVKKGQVEIGVVAYLVENEEKIKRYNPSPAYFNTLVGSLKDNAENSEPITPSEMEQFEQALNDGLNEVANVNIDAEKTGNKSVVTITNRNGEEKTVEILDGTKGDKGKDGEDYVITQEDYQEIADIVKEEVDIPTALSDLQDDSTHRTVTDTEKNTWNNKSDFSGDYDDLSNKPTIPTVNVDDVQVNGTSIVSDGVANIPMGTTQSLGVVKAKTDAGTTINQSGELIINPASDQQIKEGTGNRRPITPDKENAAVFYGLAKASGDTTQASSSNAVGTYTTEAKASIRSMLGADGNDWEQLVDKTLEANNTTALAYTDYAYEGKFKKIMVQIRGTVDTNNANISFYRSLSSSAYQVFGNVARNSDTLYEFIMEGSPYLQSAAIRDSSVELKVYNTSSNTWTMLYQGRAPMATKMDEVTDLKITSNGNFLTGTRVVVWGLR